jgi:hypothetical protein
VLGGEQSGPENLDPIVWPRAAVAAEVFWTGAILSGGAARNVQEALPGLHDIRKVYVLNLLVTYLMNLQSLNCKLSDGSRGCKCNKSPTDVVCYKTWTVRLNCSNSLETLNGLTFFKLLVLIF